MAAFLLGGTAVASSGDNVSDPDITGMALQALAKYKDREDVAKVIDEAPPACRKSRMTRVDTLVGKPPTPRA